MVDGVPGATPVYPSAPSLHEPLRFSGGIPIVYLRGGSELSDFRDLPWSHDKAQMPAAEWLFL